MSKLSTVEAAIAPTWADSYYIATDNIIVYNTDLRCVRYYRSERRFGAEFALQSKQRNTFKPLPRVEL